MPKPELLETGLIELVQTVKGPVAKRGKHMAIDISHGRFNQWFVFWPSWPGGQDRRVVVVGQVHKKPVDSRLIAIRLANRCRHVVRYQHIGHSSEKGKTAVESRNQNLPLL